MSVFVVISTDKNIEEVRKLDDLISTKYADNSIKLADHSWLVSAQDVNQPKEVFHTLLGEDTSVSCLIVPFQSYWGVQPNSTWSWLSSKGL